MTTPDRMRRLAAAAAIAVLPLAGCLPKPNTLATRSYLLTPVAVDASPQSPRAEAEATAVGINPVRMPSYLLRPSVAVRSGTSEVVYLETSLWADRLDRQFQRVLAEDLAARLPYRSVRLAPWSSGEVTQAVSINVLQFDVDTTGTGSLIAWWQVHSASGGGLLTNGTARLTESGPPPDAQPEAIPATLSRLVSRLAALLAEALQTSGVGAPAR